MEGCGKTVSLLQKLTAESARSIDVCAQELSAVCIAQLLCGHALFDLPIILCPISISVFQNRLQHSSSAAPL